MGDRALHIITERARFLVSDELVTLSPQAIHVETSTVDLCISRTQDIVLEWFRLNAIKPDSVPLTLLARSCYLQGVTDMAKVAIDTGWPGAADPQTSEETP